MRRCPYRAPLLWLLIPFGAGAALHRVGLAPPTGLLPAALGVLGALLAFAFPATACWQAGITGAMTTAGIIAFAALDHAPLALPARGLPTELDLTIEQISPPRERAHPRGWFASGFGRTLDRGETVYFSCDLDSGGAPPARGARVRLAGTLKPVPGRGGADSFNGYLRGRGIKYELSPAWVRRTLRPPPAYARAREALAVRMERVLGAGFEGRPDLGAIYRAMMLGRRDGLTAADKALFLRTGTMHLFAINGLHIGIVAVSAHALLALLRLRGLGAVLPVLGILWVDVDATGASPSALRAFVMVALLAVGRAAALPANPLAALAAAAAALLIVRPAELFSASFQLSFSVVLTLLLLGAPLADELRRCLPQPVAAALGFSLAAAGVSSLTGITYFSNLSLIAPAANLALMPVASLVIVSGFAALVSGLLGIAPLAALFNSAAGLLLRMLRAGLDRFAGLPGAAWSAHYRADWIGPAALALFLALCLRGYAGDWRTGRHPFAPPFIAVALTLVLGVSYRP